MSKNDYDREPGKTGYASLWSSFVYVMTIASTIRFIRSNRDDVSRCPLQWWLSIVRPEKLLALAEHAQVTIAGTSNRQATTH